MFFQGKCKVDYLVDCIPAAEHSDQVHLVAGAYSGDLHLLDVTDPDEIILVKSLENGHSDTVRCLHWDKEVWILCDAHLWGWWGGMCYIWLRMYTQMTVQNGKKAIMISNLSLLLIVF